MNKYPIMYLYRVFLQDEKDAPSPLENPLYAFRIRSGKILAWCYSSPAYKPNLEEQLKAMNFGSRLNASDKPLDDHFLINYDSLPLGIVHTQKEIPDKTYKLAREQAIKLAEYLSREQNRKYIFIDVTSKSDKELAKKLSQIIHSEEVHSASPRAVDIGD